MCSTGTNGKTTFSSVAIQGFGRQCSVAKAALKNPDEPSDCFYICILDVYHVISSGQMCHVKG